MECRFCNEKLIHCMVDLGMSPLANGYLDAKSLEKKELFLLSSPVRTLLSALKFPTRLKCWKTIPIFVRISVRFCWVTVKPSNNTFPEDCSTKPFIVLNKVVFPEPLGPKITVNSPSLISSEIFLSALVPSGNVLDKFSKLSIDFSPVKFVCIA